MDTPASCSLTRTTALWSLCTGRSISSTPSRSITKSTKQSFPRLPPCLPSHILHQHGKKRYEPQNSAISDGAFRNQCDDGHLHPPGTSGRLGGAGADAVAVLSAVFGPQSSKICLILQVVQTKTIIIHHEKANIKSSGKTEKPHKVVKNIK